MIRVVVVDDSVVARRLIAAILGAQPDIEVVGEARDGIEAVSMVAALRPDVVTMDIQMPRLDGYGAAQAIMAATPTPIVMVSAHEPNEMQASFRAIEAGALTVLAKPSGAADPSLPGDVSGLIGVVRAMAGLRMVTRRGRHVDAPRAAAPRTVDPDGRVDLIAIAASTGGPAALATILRGLPGPPPVPIVVVQHIADGFDDGLVTWLDSLTALPVRMARDGAMPVAGEVLVAPNGTHVGVTSSGRIRLNGGPPIGGHRPSATFMFQSVAASLGARALGVILTGIGRDGADGLARLAEAGGRVIAQDEASSVVYGMPRVVVEAGLASDVVPVERIAAALARAWSAGRPSV